MKQKHWKVSVFDKTSETIRDDAFYTTDTEAYLIFELIDEDFTPDSATVTVYNIYGKATNNANAEVADGIVRYEMPVDAIGHPGGWRTQVIFTEDNEDYTTKIIEFDVGGHLLDNKKPAIVDIENWNSYPVKNPVMGIDERLRVVATTIDINSPENSNLRIGDKFKRGTEYQVDAQRASRRVVELENEVNYERIRGNRIRQELTQKTNELQQIVDELDTSQIPVIEAALLDINQSIGDLQTSIGGIPVYTLATANNDGLMSKEDKQKLDTLIIPDYTEEFNQINIQFVDLVQRIEALEGDGE